MKGYVGVPSLNAGSRAKKGICLVPVADLLNHNPQQHVAWHTGGQGADAFHIVTYKEIAKARSLHTAWE